MMKKEIETMNDKINEGTKELEREYNE